MGGFSVILYGYSRTAGDLDFWVNKSTENYARLVKAINEFGMPVFDMTKENFLNHPFCDVSSFGRSPVSIDIMTSVKRLDFKETYRNSKIFEVQGIQIRTFHKNDLIKAKKASNCPKDEEDLNNIGDKKKFLKKIMPLTPLTPRPSFEENPNLAKAADNLRTLLTAIAQKKIPRLQEQKINEIIAGVNNSLGQDPELLKQKKAAQTAIIKLLEQDLQLVPKNHYQLQWLVLGMAAFGISNLEPERRQRGRHLPGRNAPHCGSSTIFRYLP